MKDHIPIHCKKGRDDGYNGVLTNVHNQIKDSEKGTWILVACWTLNQKKGLLGKVFNKMAKDNMLKVVIWIGVGITSCDSEFMQE